MISEGQSRFRAALNLLRSGKHSTDPAADSGADLESDVGFVRRRTLLDHSEMEVYRVLVQAIGPAAVVCPKTRVTSVLAVAEASRNIAQAARIDRKTIDLLICDLAGMEPRLVIQIDHWNEHRQAYEPRDPFVDRALTAAGVTVFHVRDDQIPSPERMRAKILPLLDSEVGPSEHSGGQPPTPKISIHPGHAPHPPR